MKDLRSYNVGESNYSVFNIQPWDIWESYQLNPWDADIIKRLLRTKKTDSRKLDLEKIKHIAEFMLEKATSGSYIQTPATDSPIGIMAISYEYNLSTDEGVILMAVLKSDINFKYQIIINYCNRLIEELR